jgi:WD40 repeat protein
MSVAFSADGERVAACSSLDGGGSVMVALTADAKQLLKIDVPESGLYSVTFHPNSNLIAAAGFDGQVRVIDVTAMKIVNTFVPVPLDTVAATE